MSGDLRAGVVGVGHLGQHHARLYATLDGVRLVGVVDADRARAEEIAARHGARVFESVESLAREVDVASVASPTSVHLETARPLLEAGVATLVEKPIADTVAAGRELVDVARARGVPLMVGHIERFHPAIAAIRAELTAPRFVEIHRLAPFVPRALDVDVVLDLMVHDLDLCRLLLGTLEVEHLEAAGASALTDTIDLASVRLRFAGGAQANLTASRISFEKVRRIRVFEPGSYLWADTGTGDAGLFRVHREGGERRIERRPLDVPREEPLAREIGAFLAAVRVGEKPPCPGEDGLAALELALRIRDRILDDPLGAPAS